MDNTMFAPTLKRSPHQLHRKEWAREGSNTTCSRCVMDTTDPDIVFDENGVCSNCTGFLNTRERLLVDDDGRESIRDAIVGEIRRHGASRRYDCIIGVSGGVDSTYVAYITKKLGLRPLAVHVDNGWNSEIAVGNIEKVLKKLDIDLYTYVIDWGEFRDLQIAFLKSSTVDGEMPTDHAIRAVLRRVAAREKVRYIINGRNLSTEGLLPWSWSYCALDWKYVKAVHRRHGAIKLRTFPKLPLSSLIYNVATRSSKNVSILNYVPFTKDLARDVLVNELKWVDYGGKHYESIYTRFFQGHILPKKFNIDKRKAHLSSLICTGQVTREAALNILRSPPLPKDVEDSDREFTLKKLRLTEKDFERIMASPPKTYRDYPNHSHFFLFRQHKRMKMILDAMKSLQIFPRDFAPV